MATASASVEASMQKDLTEASNHLLDFSKVANLAKHRVQDSYWGLWSHYSWRELFVRGGIVATTAMAGYWAYQTTGESSVLTHVAATAGASAVGFFTAHSVAVVPTVRRRNQIRVANAEHYCDISRLIKQLQKDHTPDKTDPTFVGFSMMIVKMSNYLGYANTLSLTTNDRGNAARTLTHRGHLLRAMKERLETRINMLENGHSAEILSNMMDVWNKENDDISHDLEEKFSEAATCANLS